ncbi:DUF2064 domain-containing protein [uncultured Fibrella sp.]|uniref:DUF2064 domain-containing protein n=1 Tax=uncultured Fibrella sp. TaxID=1284596 RepID=UPI0035CB2C53
MINATAILIFAQPVSIDVVRKRVATQPLLTRRILERLNERTRQTAEATAMPVIHSATLIKCAGTFGEQFDRACRAAFALGFERLLVIGNDCPALTSIHLLHAADQLQQASVVIGPDQRGGLYLLGITRASFEVLVPGTLPWQTCQLARAVRQLLVNLPVVVMPRLGDVNKLVDLYQYQSGTLAVTLFIAQLLLLDVGEPMRSTNQQLAQPTDVYPGTRFLRGPPIAGISVLAA